jgi:hypothetical protein
VTASFTELSEMMAAKKKTPGELKLYAEAFARATRAQWHLTTQIQLIYTALAIKVGSGDCLLVRWTNALLAEVALGKIDRVTAYKTLEAYFNQALARQMLAVSMHCVALGVDPKYPDAAAEYTRDEFAPKMKDQTRVFLCSAERLMLESVPMLKVPSIFPPDRSAEFPWEMEAVLLRADLMCAALNLVSKNEKKKEKDIVAGIYGRVLARPSDVRDEKNLPQIAVGTYARKAGSLALRKIGKMRVVDLHLSQGKLKLGGHETDEVSVIRYFWPWPATLPKQGVPIDSSMRGGVRPEFYNIFDDDDWPLAASFVDFSRVVMGAPPEAKTSLDIDDKFPSAGPHAVLLHTYSPPDRHLLAKGTATKVAWKFSHSSPANGTWPRRLQFPLFDYKGEKNRMRLTVNSRCEVHHLEESVVHKKQGGRNDLNVLMKLARPDGTEQIFLNAQTESGGALDTRKHISGYKKSREFWSTIEFDVTDGTWGLRLDLQNCIRTSTFYVGWKQDQVDFDVLGVYVEWLPAAKPQKRRTASASRS